MTLRVVTIEAEDLICVCFLAIDGRLQRSITYPSDEHVEECQSVVRFCLDCELDALENAIDQIVCCHHF